MSKHSFLVILCLVSIAFCVTAYAEGKKTTDYEQFAEENEPRPYGGLSLYEQNSFESIQISPEEFMQALRQQRSAQGVSAFFASIGLPFDENDCEYVFGLKDTPQSTEYPAQGALSSIEDIITITYTYQDSENDNCVFIFWAADAGYSLVDVIFDLGNAELVMNAPCETAWLVGDTGSAYVTTRWYNIPDRKIALDYLASGTEVDPVDYHVKVKSQSDAMQNGCFPKNQMLAIRKQVSLIDYTNQTQPSEGTEILLYTVMDVYFCQPNGALALIASKKFANSDIAAVADITCGMLVSNDCETP